jgi:hypothetical protein
VTVGTLADGSQVDLFRGGKPVDWSVPELPSRLYPDTRWRQFMSALDKKAGEKARAGYAYWEFRRWNGTHALEPERRLEKVEVIYMRRATLPDLTYGPLEKVLLYTLRRDPSKDPK